MASTWDSLPLDILCRVFELLPARDQQNMLLVHPHWRLTFPRSSYVKFARFALRAANVRQVQHALDNKDAATHSLYVVPHSGTVLRHFLKAFRQSYRQCTLDCHRWGGRSSGVLHHLPAELEELVIANASNGQRWNFRDLAPLHNLTTLSIGFVDGCPEIDFAFLPRRLRHVCIEAAVKTLVLHPLDFLESLTLLNLHTYGLSLDVSAFPRLCELYLDNGGTTWVTGHNASLECLAIDSAFVLVAKLPNLRLFASQAVKDYRCLAKLPPSIEVAVVECDDDDEDDGAVRVVDLSGLCNLKYLVVEDMCADELVLPASARHAVLKNNVLGYVDASNCSVLRQCALFHTAFPDEPVHLIGCRDTVCHVQHHQTLVSVPRAALPVVKSEYVPLRTIEAAVERLHGLRFPGERCL